MEKSWFAMVIIMNVLLIIYLSILSFGLIRDIFKHIKKLNHLNLSKKYDSGYNEMFKKLHESIDFKNDENYLIEEDRLSDLKQLIENRLNELNSHFNRK